MDFGAVWRLAARGSAPSPSSLGVCGRIEEDGGPRPAADRPRRLSLPSPFRGAPPGPLRAPCLTPPPPTASARCICRIITTSPNQFFVLYQVAPLSHLSLLIRVGVHIRIRVGACVGVRPTAADPPPRGDVVPTVEIIKCKPRSLLHKEAAVNLEGAGLLLFLLCTQTLSKVEGGDLLLVLVCMYPLCTRERKNYQFS